VEVLVVTAIVLVGMALAIPAIHAAQIFARRARAENNLKQIGLALHNYLDSNGVFPMSAVASEDAKQHGVGHSGFTALLPFLERASVYNHYNFSLEPWDAVNSTVTRVRVNEFLAPENKDIESKPAEKISLHGKPLSGKNQFGPLHFGMNWGGGHEGFGDDFVARKGKYKGLLMTVLDAEGRKAGARNVGIAQITDGTSFTLALVEKRDSVGWAIGGFAGSEFDAFTSPAYAADDPVAKQVFTGTVVATGPRGLLADGSVRVILPSMSKDIWYALLTRDGGEAINPFE
jgi:type II secretory pathway pseudopilin PulG